MIRKVVLGLALLLVLGVGFLRWNEAQQRKMNRAYDLLADTKAQVALLHAERDSLLALYEAADESGGEVVAGVRIVTRPDTVFVPVSSVETREEQGTRFATLTDTTEHGFSLRLDAEAPPYPHDLRLGYELQIPSFRPTVGFIEDGSVYTAVVTWEGMEFTLDNALYIPQKEIYPQPSFSVVMGAGAAVSKGVQSDLYTGVRVNRGMMYSLDLGYGGGLFLRAGVEKKLW